MSRWKRLDNWDEKLEELSVEGLRAELAFWKQRAAIFGHGPAWKLTMKSVHRVAAVLRLRLFESAE